VASATVDKIERVLETVRPAIRMDGGDVEFVDFDESEGTVTLRLMGHCVGCPMSMATLRNGIEARLRLAVPAVRSVEAQKNVPAEAADGGVKITTDLNWADYLLLAK
jgi:Fe-S cluster biogenesis protein NfuA